MTPRSVALKIVDVADGIMPVAPGISILIYHRVGAGSTSNVDTDVPAFRSQLAHLVAHHEVITLSEAGRRLQQTQPSSSAVVVTFDDGTADFVDHAVPALLEAQIPATLYACTQSIDEQRDFPWGAPPASWSGLRDAASTGLISIESHTHTHALLDRIPEEDIADELDRSIELIGEHIGAAPRHFAYPKAVPGSPASDAAVRSRFDSASLARGRVNRVGRSDSHHLWRTPILRRDDVEAFASKAAGRGRIEGELRHQLARWKYRNDLR